MPGHRHGHREIDRQRHDLDFGGGGDLAGDTPRHGRDEIGRCERDRQRQICSHQERGAPPQSEIHENTVEGAAGGAARRDEDVVECGVGLDRQVLPGNRVAAAGNHGNVASRPAKEVPAGLTEQSPSYPAALPGVLAVGALEDAKPAPFSPKDAPWIRLMAPGVDLTVAYLSGNVLVAAEDGTFRHARDVEFGGWAKCSGTSYAAGMVTGEIAQRMTRPGVTAQEAAAQLLSLVTEGVFVKFPELKVVMMESGVTWLPGMIWRADKTGRGVRSPRAGIHSRRPAVLTRAQMAPSRANVVSSGCMTPPRRRTTLN